jgi:eukaryotic-like serine/threonine-protein kinase
VDLRAQLQTSLGTAFSIERELGGGGMSRVFVANEVRLSRRVVIKVLNPDLVQGLNAQRFEREILLAASLQQANIVPVLAAGEVDGLPWFTMPFVEGESLRKRLDGQGLPITDVLAILRDVTKALAYAHAHGIVHRDIKPDNVLLSGGTAVVTDFGIAKALSASLTGGVGGTLTQLGTAIGTPAYMAPEQVAGDPNLDHRVDLYALGCVAQELLTGKSPFADRTPQKMLAAHLSEPAMSVSALRPDCPAPLAALVRRLLQKDPADRVQSAAEVLQALDSVGTTSSPTTALSGPGMLPKALGLYALATAAVALLAKAAVVGIGLPDWVFPGAVLVMLLGLPVLLVTAYVKRVARQAVTATPTLTPGGSMVPGMPSGTIATMALKANRHLSWRRTARGGFYAMGGFVLLVTGFMSFRALGIGPWGSLLASGSLAANSRMVVADFTAAPEDSSLAPIIAEAVRAAMSQSTSIRIMEPGEVSDILQQMRRSRDTPLEPGVAREVATRGGAAAVLNGRLARVGTGYAVSLELTSAADQVSLASYQGTADGVKDLLGVVDGLARKLRGKIGESLKRVQRSVPLEQATTTSLEALRKYSEAVRANDVDQDYDRAARAAHEAVALDSTFALAWRKLSVALFNARGSPSAQDSALEQAARYADRLPVLERSLVRGAYYERHRIHADRGKAIAAYQAAYAADSLNTTALNQLALLHASRRQYDSAMTYGRREFKVQPTAANALRIASGLIFQGHLDEGATLIDSVAAAAPDVAGTAADFGVRTSLYLARGQGDSVTALAERASRSASVPVRLNALQRLASQALLGGQLNRFVTVSTQRNALLVERGGVRIDGMAQVGVDVRFRGRQAAGAQELESIVAGRQWTAAAPKDRPYVWAATLFAWAGRPERARQLLARYQAEDPAGAGAAQNRQSLAVAQGEIALAEGNSGEALRQFRAGDLEEDGAPTACEACTAYNLARAYDQAGQPDSAIGEYERYLTVPPVARPDPIALAEVRKRLGELYDSRNERQKAVAHYTAFVDQWKSADPDLQPVVKTVKRRLDQLRAQEGE